MKTNSLLYSGRWKTLCRWNAGYNSVSKDTHVHQKSKVVNEVQLCTGCAEKHHLSSVNCVAITSPKSPYNLNTTWQNLLFITSHEHSGWWDSTGFAAETDGNTWPWLKAGIGETHCTLTSVLERKSKAGLKILEPNFLNQSRTKLNYWWCSHCVCISTARALVSAVGSGGCWVQGHNPRCSRFLLPLHPH